MKKLIAITAVKYGKNGETAEPGQEFDVDNAIAKDVIANGGAATPEDYEKIKAAARTPEQINAEMAAENAALREENAALKAQAAGDGKGKK